MLDFNNRSSDALSGLSSDYFIRYYKLYISNSSYNWVSGTGYDSISLWDCNFTRILAIKGKYTIKARSSTSASGSIGLSAGSVFMSSNITNTEKTYYSPSAYAVDCSGCIFGSRLYLYFSSSNSSDYCTISSLTINFDIYYF